MDIIRKIVSSALSIRKLNKVRVRQPLQSLVIRGKNHDWAKTYFELIKEEVNIKEIILEAPSENMDMLQLKINPRLLGPRVGNKVQSIIKKSKEGDWVKKGNTVFVDDFELFDGEYDIESVSYTHLTLPTTPYV